MALEERVKDINIYCPHYYDIINAQFNEDDAITKKLIKEFYEEIFNISNNNLGTINRLKVLDLVMYEYLMKDSFYYYVKETFLNNTNAIDIDYDNVLDNVVIIFREYTLSKGEKEEGNDEPRWL